jgi:hypothetical protein
LSSPKDVTSDAAHYFEVQQRRCLAEGKLLAMGYLVGHCLAVIGLAQHTVWSRCGKDHEVVIEDLDFHLQCVEEEQPADCSVERALQMMNPGDST